MKRGFLYSSGLAVLFFGAAAHAQERLNGFFLTTPMSVSSGYDQNLISGPQELDESVTLLTTPTVAWFKSTHETLFSVDYQGEFSLYANAPGLDAWNHAANLRFSHRLSARWNFDVFDSFLSTDDPTRRMVNSLVLLPIGRYQENDLYARLAYRIDRKTVVSWRFDNSYTTMILPPALAGRLDRAGFSGTMTVDRKVRARHALSASYAYLYLLPLQSGPVTTASIGTVGYTFTVNPNLAIRAAGGITDSTRASFTGSAAVDKRVGGLWLSAGYQRYLALAGGVVPGNSITPGAVVAPNPFLVGLVPSSIYQVGTIRAWGRLSNRWGLQGAASRALNGVTLANQGIKSVVLQLRVDYKVNDRVTAFVRSDFFGENINEFTTFPMSRRRYFAGFEVALTRPPELSDDRHRKNPDPDDSSQQPGGEDHSEGH